MLYFKLIFVTIYRSNISLYFINIQNVKQDILENANELMNRISFMIALLNIDISVQGILRYNDLLNPYLTNGFSHHYKLGESTFIFRGARSGFYFYLIFG